MTEVFLCFILSDKAFYGQLVTLESEAHDHPLSSLCNIALVSVAFSLEGVGDMYFYHWSFNRFYSVSDSNGGVSICSRI